MKRADRVAHASAVDDAGDVDLARRDDLDVEARLREGVENPGYDTRRAQTRADHAHLGDIGGRRESLSARGLGQVVEHARGPTKIRLGDGEAHVSGAVVGHVLNDDVDVDRLVGQWSEYGRRHAGAVRHTQQRDLGHVRLVRDAAYFLPFFHVRVIGDDGARVVVERRAYAYLHRIRLADLDRAWMDHAGTGRGELEHLVVRDERNDTRVGDDAGICSVHTGHVGEDLAAVGVEGNRERHCGCVRTASPQGRDIKLLGGTLKPGDDHDT